MMCVPTVVELDTVVRPHQQSGERKHILGRADMSLTKALCSTEFQ